MKRLISSSKSFIYLFLFFYPFLSKAQIELISNGNFEANSNNGWITSDFGVIYTNSDNARSGQKYGVMPVYEGEAQNDIGGRLSQRVTIPANASNTILSFYIQISTKETTNWYENDKMEVKLKDDYGNEVYSIISFSNIHWSPSYTYHDYSIPTYLAGQSLILEFRATNNSSLPTTFRIDDVSLKYTAPSNCVQWLTGVPEQIVKDAAEFLCSKGYIENRQDISALNQFNLVDACRIVCKSLSNPEQLLPLENYPSPFVDIENLTQFDKRIINAMLYLEYDDGIAPLSRDFFWLRVQSKPNLGQIARLILEAFDIKPDNSGFDPNLDISSSFCCEVKANDYYYGWFKKANDLGFFDNLYRSCNCEPTYKCFRPEFINSPWKTFYILLQNVIIYKTNAITYATKDSFYEPNNLSFESSNNEVGIQKAVFNDYKQNSFSIPGYGFSLDFTHSYSSYLLDLPTLSHHIWNASSIWENAISTLNPLGLGWSHTYNSHIQRIYEFDYSLSRNVDRKYCIRWADGSMHIYDKDSLKYDTRGVYDKLIITETNSDGGPQKITITKPNQIRYVFEIDNDIFKLTRIIDRNDNSLILEYEPRVCLGFNRWCQFASTRLKTVRDETTNRSLVFSYHSNSNYISSVTDGTRVINFIMYNDGRTLRSYQNTNSEHTEYKYDTKIGSNYLLTSITLPKGNTIDNTYFQRKLQQTKNNSYIIDVKFEPKYQNISVETDTKLTITKNGQTFTQTYGHDKFGNLTSVRSNTEDVSIKYNHNHPTLPEEVLDNKTNIKQVFFYDGNGNLIRREKHAQNIKIAEVYLFNNLNDIIEYTDANGSKTKYEYDIKGNLKEIREPDGGISKFEINSYGQVISNTNPSNLKTIYGYNAYGNLNHMQNDIDTNIHIVTQAQYDNVSRIISTINPKGVQTNYNYDLKDNLKSIIEDQNGLYVPTSYTYDENDNLTKITNAKGNATTLVYHEQTDDLIKEEFEGDFKTWSYNTDGTTNTFTNKNGVVFNYLYYEPGDSREGLLKNDGYAQYDYYPESKKVKTVTKDGKILTYHYDIFLRVSKIDYNDFDGNSVQYTYDNNDNITKITYPGGANRYIDYTYDKNNRLTKVTDWQSRILVQYAYLADGRLLSETLGNGTKALYFYDTIGRLDSIAIQKSNGSLLAYFAMKLDANGNIISETRNEVENTGFPNLAALNSAYTTDASNRLRNVDGTTINYDKAGNQTVVGSGQFTFDSKNNLLSAPSSNGNLTFEYDPLGNRRKQNNTRYVLDILNNSNVLMDTDQSGSPISLYVHGNGLVCRYDIASNSYSYFHFDMRGSTVAITDAGGNTVTHKYQYGPFGESLQSTESFPQPFRYVGKFGVMVDAPNLYFMRARYYNPTIGRFLGEDPIWSTNLYEYSKNNPINIIDPNGEYAQILLGAFFGMAISVTGSAVFALIERKDYNWKDFKDAAVSGASIGAAATINPLFGLSMGIGFLASQNMNDGMPIGGAFGNAMVSSGISFLLLNPTAIPGNVINANLSKLSNQIYRRLFQSSLSEVEKKIGSEVLNNINETILGNFISNKLKK